MPEDSSQSSAREPFATKRGNETPSEQLKGKQRTADSVVEKPVRVFYHTQGKVSAVSNEAFNCWIGRDWEGWMATIMSDQSNNIAVNSMLSMLVEQQRKTVEEMKVIVQSNGAQLDQKLDKFSDNIDKRLDTLTNDMKKEMTAVNTRMNTIETNFNGKFAEMETSVAKKIEDLDKKIQELDRAQGNRWEQDSNAGSMASAGSQGRNGDALFVPRRVHVRGWSPPDQDRKLQMSKEDALALGNRILQSLKGTTISSKVSLIQPQLRNWQITFLVAGNGIVDCTQVKAHIMRLTETDFFKDVPGWNAKCYAMVERSWQQRQATKGWWDTYRSLSTWLDNERQAHQFRWDETARALLDTTTYDYIGKWRNQNMKWEWMQTPEQFQQMYTFDRSHWRPPGDA